MADEYRYHIFPARPIHITFRTVVARLPILTEPCALGNVTYACPGFHGGFAIPAEPGAFNHTPSFTNAAGTSKAHELTIITAKGMAIAGWTVLSDDDVAWRVKKDFEEDKKVREWLSLS